MDYIEITGYKSIKDAKIQLKPINILIGANGAGKSNFISFFEFLNNVYNKKLSAYVALNGGPGKLLYNGLKSSNIIYTYISFEGGVNGYSFTITRGEEEFIFTEEDLWYNNNPCVISKYGKEAQVISDGKYRAKYVRNHLNGFKKYHFHDTGKRSPFNDSSNVLNDQYFLYERGENLPAFLYMIRENYALVYNIIIKTIQSIAPFFSDFFFQPNNENYIRLQWQSKYSSVIFGPTDLSDGTIRFIALTTLFMQPNLPTSIIIDEPELGLHPFAISKLAGMIKSVAAKGTQVILATQSADLVNHFDAEDIITVDQENGESKFSRLNNEQLSEWLEDYSIGDLWQRNILEGGQP